MSFSRRKSTLYLLKRTRKISFLVHFLIHLATVTTRTSSDVPRSLCEFPYISIDTLVAHRCGLTFFFRGITNYTPKYQKFQSLESSRIYILFSSFLWKRVKQLVCRSSSYGGGCDRTTTIVSQEPDAGRFSSTGEAANLFLHHVIHGASVRFF